MTSTKFLRRKDGSEVHYGCEDPVSRSPTRSVWTPKGPPVGSPDVMSVGPISLLTGPEQSVYFTCRRHRAVRGCYDGSGRPKTSLLCVHLPETLEPV